MANNNWRFWVLGGNDGEMEAIKALLALAGERWVQPKLSWGDYHFSMSDIGLPDDGGNGAKDGPNVLVFVECKPKKDFILGARVQVIDHHGELASNPPSVIQVLKILEDGDSGLRVSSATRRWLELVGANDAGAYNGMEGLGASPDEMQRVRAFTKKAQGVTADHEAAAKSAVEAATMVGNVLLVQSDCALKNVCVLDLLYQQGRANEMYLVAGGGAFHFCGDGEICARMRKKFKGWSGGAGLGKKGDRRAFWGCNGAAVMVDEILAEINR